jgi:hypothetical protein
VNILREAASSSKLGTSEFLVQVYYQLAMSLAGSLTLGWASFLNHKIRMPDQINVIQ